MATLLASCSELPDRHTPLPDTTKSVSATPIIDSARLHHDLDQMIGGALSGKPDTAQIKAAGADILSTAANVLSDSGISTISGGNADPSAAAAKNLLIRMRNSIGINPAALDSMRRAGKMLGK